MFETTPVVVDGAMYLVTPYNRVVTLDPASGLEFLELRAEGLPRGAVA